MATIMSSLALCGDSKSGVNLGRCLASVFGGFGGTNYTTVTINKPFRIANSTASPVMPSAIRIRCYPSGTVSTDNKYRHDSLAVIITQNGSAYRKFKQERSPPTEIPIEQWYYDEPEEFTTVLDTPLVVSYQQHYYSNQDGGNIVSNKSFALIESSNAFTLRNTDPESWTTNDIEIAYFL
ncbi:MAG: hypothetical protein LBS51_08530 [Oscillospiraceae bacterium]|jgi:hypothetical protein|nr:hypothetical protein [Oscillospiraceae bacterium]